MKTNFLFCLAIILAFELFSGQAHSQTDDNGAPYFPLTVGNAFYYVEHCYDRGGNFTYFVISRITNSKDINGKTYYYCTNFCGVRQNFYIRYDDVSGNIVRYDSSGSSCNYEYVLFRLSSNIKDTIQTLCRDKAFNCYWVNDTTFFDISTRQKLFNYGYDYGSSHRVYDYHFLQNLGCVNNNYSEKSSYYSLTTQYFLQGCNINGVVYGDTVDHVIPVYEQFGKYMPLAIGNKWVYMYFNDPPTSQTKVVISITKDTTVGDRKYFYITIFGSPYWVRFDAYSGRLMVYSGYLCNNDYETIIYDLAANKGDSTALLPCFNGMESCSGVKDTVYLRHHTKFKYYGYYWTNGHYYSYSDHNFALDLGLYFRDGGFGGNAFGYYSYSLLGCYINGTLYGDTTSIILNTGNSITQPLKFSLEQNYPNPFNPSTVIKFEIPNSENGKWKIENGVVTLKVYDVLGKEIETLVNENLKPGTYEVKFDGSKLSSGIYFYTLAAGEYNETKKMVLIK